MLLDDDVVAQRQSEPSSLSRRLSRKERVEHLFFDLGRNAGAVVANPDLYAVAQIFGRGGERGLVIAAVFFRVALCRRIKAVGDEIQQHPGNLLRKQIDLSRGRIERSC